MVTDSNIPNGDISHSLQKLQKLNIKSTVQPVVYKMDYPCRGKAVIINQTRFDPMTGMSNREGTDPDIEGLDRVFSNLGFRTEAHSDLTIAEFRKLLIERKLSLETSSSYDFLSNRVGCAIKCRPEEFYVCFSVVRNLIHI